MIAVFAAESNTDLTSALGRSRRVAIRFAKFRPQWPREPISRVVNVSN